MNNLSKKSEMFRSSHSLFLRVISFSVLLAFLCQDLAYGFDSAKADPLTSQKPISIPAQYGTVRKFSGGQGPLVINIQDAHQKLGAQASIANILESLVSNYNLQLVGIEGADGAVDTSVLSSLPDAKIKKKAGEYLLREGLISAGEFYSIISENPVSLYGVEDDRVYQKNRNVFKKLVEAKPALRRELKILGGTLRALEGKVYNPALKELNLRKMRRASGEMKFNEYWEYFSGLAVRHEVSYKKYANLKKIVEALSLEKRIHFEKASIERESLIKTLSAALPPNELEELIRWMLEFKQGKISSADFYRGLIWRAQALPVDPAGYENVRAYSEYTALYESIDLISIFDEAEKFENEIRQTLFVSEDEKELTRLSSFVEILSRLLDVTLGAGEYDLFRSNRSFFKISEIRRRILNFSSKYQVEAARDIDFDVLERQMPDAEEFYELASKRNEILLQNTLKKMRKDHARVAALVTGGFHSEGLSRLMEDEHVSCLVVMPKFEANSPDRPYISVLTRKPKEYEKLFKDSDLYLSGEALFTPARLREFGVERFAALVAVFSRLSGNDFFSKKPKHRKMFGRYLRRLRAAGQDKALTGELMRAFKEISGVRRDKEAYIVTLGGREFLVPIDEQDVLPAQKHVTARPVQVQNTPLAAARLALEKSVEEPAETSAVSSESFLTKGWAFAVEASTLVIPFIFYGTSIFSLTGLAAVVLFRSGLVASLLVHEWAHLAGALRFAKAADVLTKFNLLGHNSLRDLLFSVLPFRQPVNLLAVQIDPLPARSHSFVSYAGVAGSFVFFLAALAGASILFPLFFSLPLVAASALVLANSLFFDLRPALLSLPGGFFYCGIWGIFGSIRNPLLNGATGHEGHYSEKLSRTVLAYMLMLTERGHHGAGIAIMVEDIKTGQRSFELVKLPNSSGNNPFTFRRQRGKELAKNVNDAFEARVRQLRRLGKEIRSVTLMGHVRLSTSKGKQTPENTQAFHVGKGHVENVTRIHGGKLLTLPENEELLFAANGDLLEISFFHGTKPISYLDLRTIFMKLYNVEIGTSDSEVAGYLSYFMKTQGMWRKSMIKSFMTQVMEGARDEYPAVADLERWEHTARQIFESADIQRALYGPDVNSLSQIRDEAAKELLIRRIETHLTADDYWRTHPRGWDRVHDFTVDLVESFLENDSYRAASQVMRMVDADSTFGSEAVFTTEPETYVCISRQQPVAIVRNLTQGIGIYGSSSTIAKDIMREHLSLEGDQVDVLRLKPETDDNGWGGEIIRLNKTDLNDVQIYSMLQERELSANEIRRRRELQHENPYNEPIIPPRVPGVVDDTEADLKIIPHLAQDADDRWNKGSHSFSRRTFDGSFFKDMKALAELRDDPNALSRYAEDLVIVSFRETMDAAYYMQKLLQYAFPLLRVKVLQGNEYIEDVNAVATDERTVAYVIDPPGSTFPLIRAVEDMRKGSERAEKDKASGGRPEESEPDSWALLKKMRQRHMGHVYVQANRVEGDTQVATGQEYGQDSPFFNHIFSTNFSPAVDGSVAESMAHILEIEHLFLALVGSLREQFPEGAPLGLTLSRGDIAKLRQSFDHMAHDKMNYLVGMTYRRDGTPFPVENAHEYKNLTHFSGTLSPYFLDMARQTVAGVTHLWLSLLSGGSLISLGMFSLSHYFGVKFDDPFLFMTLVKSPLTYLALLPFLLLEASRYQWFSYAYLWRLRRKEGREPAERTGTRSITLTDPDWHLTLVNTVRDRFGLAPGFTDPFVQSASQQHDLDDLASTVRRGSIIFMSVSSHDEASLLVNRKVAAVSKMANILQAIQSFRRVGAHVVAVGNLPLEEMRKMGFDHAVSVWDKATQEHHDGLKFDDERNARILLHYLVDAPIRLVAQGLVLSWRVPQDVSEYRAFRLFGKRFGRLFRWDRAGSQNSSVATTQSPLPAPVSEQRQIGPEALDRLKQQLMKQAQASPASVVVTDADEGDLLPQGAVSVGHDGDQLAVRFRDNLVLLTREEGSSLIYRGNGMHTRLETVRGVLHLVISGNLRRLSADFESGEELELMIPVQSPLVELGTQTMLMLGARLADDSPQTQRAWVRRRKAEATGDVPASNVALQAFIWKRPAAADVPATRIKPAIVAQVSSQLVPSGFRKAVHRFFMSVSLLLMVALAAANVWIRLPELSVGPTKTPVVQTATVPVESPQVTPQSPPEVSPSPKIDPPKTETKKTENKKLQAQLVETSEKLTQLKDEESILHSQLLEKREQAEKNKISVLKHKNSVANKQPVLEAAKKALEVMEESKITEIIEAKTSPEEDRLMEKATHSTQQALLSAAHAGNQDSFYYRHLKGFGTVHPINTYLLADPNNPRPDPAQYFTMTQKHVDYFMNFASFPSIKAHSPEILQKAGVRILGGKFQMPFADAQNRWAEIPPDEVIMILYPTEGSRENLPTVFLVKPGEELLGLYSQNLKNKISSKKDAAAGRAEAVRDARTKKIKEVRSLGKKIARVNSRAAAAEKAAEEAGRQARELELEIERKKSEEEKILSEKAAVQAEMDAEPAPLNEPAPAKLKSESPKEEKLQPEPPADLPSLKEEAKPIKASPEKTPSDAEAPKEPEKPLISPEPRRVLETSSPKSQGKPMKTTSLKDSMNTKPAILRKVLSFSDSTVPKNSLPVFRSPQRQKLTIPAGGGNRGAAGALILTARPNSANSVKNKTVYSQKEGSAGSEISSDFSTADPVRAVSKLAPKTQKQTHATANTFYDPQAALNASKVLNLNGTERSGSTTTASSVLRSSGLSDPANTVKTPSLSMRQTQKPGAVSPVSRTVSNTVVLPVTDTVKTIGLSGKNLSNSEKTTAVKNSFSASVGVPQNNGSSAIPVLVKTPSGNQLIELKQSAAPVLKANNFAEFLDLEKRFLDLWRRLDPSLKNGEAAGIYRLVRRLEQAHRIVIRLNQAKADVRLAAGAGDLAGYERALRRFDKNLRILGSVQYRLPATFHFTNRERAVRSVLDRGQVFASKTLAVQKIENRLKAQQSSLPRILRQAARLAETQNIAKLERFPLIVVVPDGISVRKFVHERHLTFIQGLGSAASRFEFHYVPQGVGLSSLARRLKAVAILDESSLTAESVPVLLNQLAVLDQRSFAVIYPFAQKLLDPTASASAHLSRAQQEILARWVEKTLPQAAVRRVFINSGKFFLQPEIVTNEPSEQGQSSRALAAALDRVLANAQLASTRLEKINAGREFRKISENILNYLSPSSERTDTREVIFSQADALARSTVSGQRARYALVDPSYRMDVSALRRAAFAREPEKTIVTDLALLKDGWTYRMERLAQVAPGLFNHVLWVRDPKIKNKKELLEKNPEAAIFGDGLIFAPQAKNLKEIYEAGSNILQPEFIVLTSKPGILSPEKPLLGPQVKQALVLALDPQAQSTIRFLETGAHFLLNPDHLPAYVFRGSGGGFFFRLPNIVPMDYQLENQRARRFAETAA